MGCDTEVVGADGVILISIHAPRVGCDEHGALQGRRQEYFNPRTPRGVRQDVSRFLTAIVRFQSTHPAWGATGRIGYPDGRFLISIHAPRVGCDYSRIDIFTVYAYFNPRTPRGVRPRETCNLPSKLLFQSTHPAWGATPDGGLWKLLRRISIHAPRVGCDQAPRKPYLTFLYFNPRTPRGVRRHERRSGRFHFPFQSTHPAWGATPDIRRDNGTALYFNPRTPRGVRRDRGKNIRHEVRISIHAPRVGCDEAPYSRRGCSCNFNPRTPRGVRQVCCLCARWLL